MAQRWENGAAKCSIFARMVNHDNNHLCADYASLADTEIVFFDPLGPVCTNSTTEFSLAQLRVLGDASLAEQVLSGGMIAPQEPWSTRYVGLPSMLTLSAAVCLACSSLFRE